MIQARVIPTLLLKNDNLVKTKRFTNPKYIGDPINAVKIYNESEADELVLLDITRSKRGLQPNFALIESIANETYMPFCYGGGITSLEDARKIIRLGAEKVCINSGLLKNNSIIPELVQKIGSQSVVGSVDIKRSFWGKPSVYSYLDKKIITSDINSHIKKIEDLGVGEIFLNSVDQDGVMSGYDLNLITEVSEMTSLPLIVCGGAGSLQHLKEGVRAGASAVAAGSLFVYHGPNKGVLINYPDRETIKNSILE